MKIQTLDELEAEMRAVARGERPAPADAAVPSVNSAEALLRLLTPDNRRLMRVIRDEKPKSLAELARLLGRAEPNVHRTVAKLEALRPLEMRAVGQRRVPAVTVNKLRVEIDPFAMKDRVEAA